MFQVHDAETSVRNVKPPQILVTRRAAEDMWIITDSVNDEVAFLGTVEYLGEEDHTFLIKDIFLPKQEVNSSTAELDPDGIAEVMQEILDQYPGDEGMELVNSIRFWGHSHVNMGVSPSGQDESELRKLAADAGDYFIAARTNKRGMIRFDMLTQSGWLYHDLKWDYEPMDEARYKGLKELIKKRVSKKTFHSKHSHNSLGKPKAGGKGKPNALDARLNELGVGGFDPDYPAQSAGEVPFWSGWDEWDEYYQILKEEEEEERKYLTLDPEGRPLAIKVKAKRKGLQWDIEVTEEDMLNAGVDPEMLLWAPYEINFDAESAWFLNGQGHHRQLSFDLMDELELAALAALMKTEPFRKNNFASPTEGG